MSDVNLARRTAVEVFFNGVNISEPIRKYFLSLTYTDNEEDATDDFQVQLQDRDSVWLTNWLNNTIQADTELEKEKVLKQYKVISASGVAIRSSKDNESKTLGTLAYGTIIDVLKIEEGFASFKHKSVEEGKTKNKTAYVDENYLQPIYKTADDISTASVSTQVTDSTNWQIGDNVTVSGTPQESSYGTGRTGTAVANYSGTITYLNLKDGVPYPIHIGTLGWFSIDEVRKSGGNVVATAENYEFEKDEASKGLKIQASIIRQNWNSTGVDERLECGQFELDNINASGPPSVITIKGTSLPYNNSIRQTKKSKSWENYTLAGIANEIAQNNGMACIFEAEDLSYDRVEQYMTSDIGFLQKLCQDTGLSLKIAHNTIIIFDQVAYESKPAIMTIVYGKKGGYLKYKLSTSANDTYSSCRVSYVNANGELIEATAYADNYNEDDEKQQCLEIKQKVNSVTEALALAKKSLKLHNKYEFTAQFTFPGNPILLAGCTLYLQGFGAWDHKYIIKKAQHTVNQSGYTTQITLRQALLSNG